MKSPTGAAAEGLIHLRAAGVSLVLDRRGSRLPTVLHWGADLGDLTQHELSQLAEAVTMPNMPGFDDVVPRASLLPEHGTGWPGQPGLTGHRQGADWSPLFTLDSVEAESASARIRATDTTAHLTLVLEAGLTPSGLVRMRAAVRNDDTLRPYTLDGLMLALPVPDAATELLDLTGRWCRERAPQRHPFNAGTWLRETRSGRTGRPPARPPRTPAPGPGPARCGSRRATGRCTPRRGRAWTDCPPASTAVLLIVPEHVAVDQDPNTGSFNTKPVGTGPYVLSSRSKGEKLTFKANPDVHHGGHRGRQRTGHPAAPG